MPDARLVPPPTKGHLSIARLARAWYVACESRELRKKPLPVELLGTPYVLFRDASGRAAALLDRCPHRNAPLSLGRVAASGRLECAYHGWQFEGSGRCALVPGLGASDTRERRAPACAVREAHGLVWVWPELDDAPTREPFALPELAPGYARVVRMVEAPATLHATLENALDVPHTAFLHRGLFRGAGERHEIRATVRRSRDRVEVEYAGEPRPSGAVGFILSPSGGTVEHWDRFILPSVAQVEYRLGRESHLTVTAFGTPVSDFVTRLYAVVDFRSPLPNFLVKPLLEPVALSIFRQDARMLRAQTETVRAFGGEQYMSTELDLIGPHVWRLLKQAETGEEPSEETSVEREVRFLA